MNIENGDKCAEPEKASETEPSVEPIGPEGIDFSKATDILFVDGDNIMYSLPSIIDVPLPPNIFVLTYHALSFTGSTVEKILAGHDRIIPNVAKNNVPNSADANMIIDLIYFMYALPLSVRFWILSADGIFREVIAKLSPAGRRIDLVRKNYMYLADFIYNIAMYKRPESSFDIFVKFLLNLLFIENSIVDGIIKTERFVEIYKVSMIDSRYPGWKPHAILTAHYLIGSGYKFDSDIQFLEDGLPYKYRHDEPSVHGKLNLEIP